MSFIEKWNLIPENPSAFFVMDNRAWVPLGLYCSRKDIFISLLTKMHRSQIFMSE